MTGPAGRKPSFSVPETSGNGTPIHKSEQLSDPNIACYSRKMKLKRLAPGLIAVVVLGGCAGEEIHRFSVSDCIRFEMKKRSETEDVAKPVCVSEAKRRYDIALAEGGHSFSMANCKQTQSEASCREQQRIVLVANRNASAQTPTEEALGILMFLVFP